MTWRCHKQQKGLSVRFARARGVRERMSNTEIIVIIVVCAVFVMIVAILANR